MTTQHLTIWNRLVIACRRLGASLCSVFLALAMSSPTNGQTDQTGQKTSSNSSLQQPDLAEMSLEDLLKVKMETVYSASKFVQKVTEAPASVTVILAEDIKRYGYRTLADVLKGVRGFYVSYDRNYSYVGSRGLLRAGDYNTRILLLINGHRINDPVYEGASIGNEALIDLSLVERVEIIRGPSSSLYGTSALLAVINVVTRRGASLNGVEASAEVSSYDSLQGRFGYGKRLKSGVDFLLSGTAYNSSGQGRLYFPEFDSALTNNGVAEHADGERFDTIFGSVNWSKVSIQASYGERRKTVPTASYESSFNTKSSFTNDLHGFVDLKYERGFGANANLAARAYFDHYKYSGDFQYEEDGFKWINRDSGIGSWWGTEVTYSQRAFKKHHFTVGTEFRDNIQQDQLNIDVSPYAVNVDDRRSSLVFAGYAQDEYSILPNLLLNVGLRYDHYPTFGGTTNPRLGLLYSPRKNTTLKLIYGQAFRAPNVYEQYYGDMYTQKPNPSLRPEMMRSVEGVVEQYIGDHLRLSFSGFSNRLSSLITQITDPADGKLVFINADKSQSHGAEFEFEYKGARGIQAGGSYTFTHSEYGDYGLTPTNSPHHLAKLNFSMPIFAHKLFAGIDSQYISSRTTLKGSGTPGAAICNFTLLGKKLHRGLGFSFSVYNFLDKRYGDPGSEEHRESLIPQDGRSYRFRLTYAFGAPE